MMIAISKKFKKIAGVALSAALLVTGVVVPEKLQNVDAASSIDLSAIKVADGQISLDSFTEYDIKGKIKSDRSLVKVTCLIAKDNGKEMGEVVQMAQWPADSKEEEDQKAGVKKLDLKKTKMNKELLSFKSLEDGKYSLYVNAVNKKGTTESKKLIFGIKCDAKSFVIRTYKTVFDKDITDEEMTKWLPVLENNGAAQLVKDMFASEEIEYLTDATFLQRLYKATFRTRVRVVNEYDPYDGYVEMLGKKNGKARVVAIFTDNFEEFRNGIKKYNVEF